MAENLCEDFWESFSESYLSLLNTLSEYNAKISSGHYLDFGDVLDANFVNDLVTAQVISLLLKDKTLYIPDREILISIIKQSQFARYIDWTVTSTCYQLIPMEQDLISSLPATLATMCIDEKANNLSKKYVRRILFLVAN